MKWLMPTRQVRQDTMPPDDEQREDWRFVEHSITLRIAVRRSGGPLAEQNGAAGGRRSGLEKRVSE